MTSPTTTLLSNRFRVNFNDDSAFIGRGGMGAVYVGTDTVTDEPVAIKSLRKDLLQNEPDMVERFQREGAALRQLNHPNIVKMIDAVQHEDEHYLIMEYVSGGSLRDVLNNEGQLSVQRVLYIALDVADALTRAHRLNILHRDIKPDNVLVAADGTPRLTDFGMARMRNESHITQEGSIVGTLGYLAPEAFRSEEPDERTDIWAFGVMLYEMLTGERPFTPQMPAALINAILTQTVPDLEDIRTDAPIALVDLVYRMLTKDRQARIPSVRLIGAELEAIIRDDNSAMQPVVSADSTGRFSALSTTPAPRVQTSSIQAPNNLPTQPTPFVGRTAELDALQAMLDDDHRLITLLGPGGMGKTRLSLAFAERQLTRYVDGVYFVSLAALDDPAHIVPTIADNIGLAFGGADARGDLLNYLREKSMLLVLDNFEHLTDGSDLLADILRDAPNVTMLVSSRERLRLRGEHIYEVGGMRLPEQYHDTESLIEQYPAVQLFVQSARRIMPAFDIDTDDTAQEVAAIIRLVGGMPLGIELAAAWLEMLPLDEIRAEIDNSLDFLETDLRDVPERHRSIRAVFEYSWNMLTDDERDTFLKLSVFRGGFEREAAGEVAAASLRGLTNLVNKSLLQRDLDGRYYVHKLLRQYAAERFADHPERDATHHAHSHYYAAFIEKLRPALNTRKEKAAIDAMDAELENIRLMCRRSVEQQQWHILTPVLDSLLWFYLGRSMLTEGYAMFDTIASAVRDDTGENDLYWQARSRQAWIGTRLGKYDEVQSLAENTLAHFADGDYPSERGYAHNHLSYVHMMRGAYEKSIAAAHEALRQIDAPEDDVIIWFMGMGNIGYAQYLKGDYAAAREIYERLNSSEIEYSATGHAYGKNNLGEILREIGAVNRALTLFHEAYDIFEGLQHKRGMAFSLNNIAGVLFMQGDYAQASEKYQRAYQMNRDIGDRTGEAHSLSALGNTALSANEYETALDYFQQSLALRRDLDDKRGIADSLSDIARCNAIQGDLAAAEDTIAESIRIRREIGDKQGEAQALAGRGIALIMMGEYAQARDDIAQAAALGAELDSVLVLAQAHVGMGELALYDGDIDQADTYYRRALRAANDIDALTFALYALLGVARVKMRRGKVVEALALVALVLRYPRNFIGVVESTAQQLFDELSSEMDADTVEETMVHSQSLALKQAVTEVLQEDDI